MARPYFKTTGPSLLSYKPSLFSFAFTIDQPVKLSTDSRVQILLVHNTTFGYENDNMNPTPFPRNLKNLLTYAKHSPLRTHKSD